VEATALNDGSNANIVGTGRRKALDRAMDEALRNPNRRRKGGDVEREAEEEVESMRQRMTRAAQADGEAREAGRPATHKLQLLPQVVALLNKNTLQHQIVDPDINLLEAVRFFLEPLPDASLPAHNIQRELFTALGRLPITKDALVASGIGKVVLFYTKSKRPEASIRRQAEKLVQDWSRPILRRTDDYRKRAFVEASYDPKYDNYLHICDICTFMSRGLTLLSVNYPSGQRGLLPNLAVKLRLHQQTLALCVREWRVAQQVIQLLPRAILLLVAMQRVQLQARTKHSIASKPDSRVRTEAPVKEVNSRMWHITALARLGIIAVF